MLELESVVRYVALRIIICENPKKEIKTYGLTEESPVLGLRLYPSPYCILI